jgi:hypothetical protein
VNFATSFALLLLGVFVLPVIISSCLPDGRNGVPWYEARRDPTGLASDPGTTPEAVIQVYAARAVSWREMFSVHTWLAVKPTGALRYTRYEVLGLALPMVPRQFALTAWAPTITGSAPDRGSCWSGAGQVSIR